MIDASSVSAPNQHVFAVLSMLCHRICCAMLYDARICWTALYYAMLRYAAVPGRTMLCWAAHLMCCAAHLMCCAALQIRCAMRCNAVRCCCRLYYVVLRCTTPCYAKRLYARLCQAMPGYGRLWKAMLGYARLC